MFAIIEKENIKIFKKYDKLIDYCNKDGYDYNNIKNVIYDYLTGKVALNHYSFTLPRPQKIIIYNLDASEEFKQKHIKNYNKINNYIFKEKIKKIRGCMQ